MTWEDIIKYGRRSDGRANKRAEKHGGFINAIRSLPNVDENWKKADAEKERKRLAREEENLPEDVKRARERVKQGLPSIEQPLIPQFDDEKRMKKSKSNLPDEAKEAIEKLTQEIKEAFESIDHNALLSILNPTGKKPSMSQKEIVDMMVKDTINRIKSNRLYE